METGREPRSWVLVVEFIAAVLVVVFLVVGAEGLDRLAQHVRQVQPQPPAAVRPQAEADARPAAPLRETPMRPPAVERPSSPVPAATPGPRSTQALRRNVRTRATVKASPDARPTPSPEAATTPTRNRQQYLTRLLNEGSRLYQAGWYGPATARFKEAARVSPESAAIHLWYGRAAYRAGRAGEARRALERVIVLAPGSEAAREARTLLDRLTARAN
ncbi:MAG: tetratricopeptide repeat protein [Armatimonadota bacterium]|nr:tetratricopeptide repeat protein [Armatimonadota bacterium]